MGKWQSLLPVADPPGHHCRITPGLVRFSYLEITPSFGRYLLFAAQVNGLTQSRASVPQARSGDGIFQPAGIA